MHWKGILMKKAITWFILFQKRILRKPMFLVTIFLIPILLVVLNLLAADSNSLIKVGLYTEADKGSSAKFVRELVESSSDVISFYICEDEGTLRNDISLGDTDCGYIIPPDIKMEVENYYTGISEKLPFKNGLIKVLTSDSSISVKVVNEVVLGKMFSKAAYSVLEDYVREKKPGSIDRPGEVDKLKGFFDSNHNEHLMFVFEYADGSENKLLNRNDNNYYMMPVRGMLSVLILVTAMSSVIMLNIDDKNGTWSWIKLSKRPAFNYMYILLSVFLVSVCSLIAIFFTKLSTNVFHEIFIMFLYVMLVSGFANLIRVLVKNIYIYCSVIPLIVLLSLVICPVFIDFGEVFYPIKVFRNVLPTSYYLESVYGYASQMKMLIGAVVISLVSCIVDN